MARTTSATLALLCGAALCATTLPAQAGTYKQLYAFHGGTDAFSPDATLLYLGGLLYGTSNQGGSGCAFPGCGTVFTVNPATGAETVLYSFKNDPDGAFPESNLVDVDGTLYTVTSIGGANGAGALVSVNPGTGATTVLQSFTSKDGSVASGGIMVIGRKLYGTAAEGGKGGSGTVFSANLASGAIAVLHAFDGTDGYFPKSGLLNLGGKLYGTADGGAASQGLLFSVDLKTHAETTVYSFAGGKDGSLPAGSLAAVNGKIYGTTAYGGSSVCKKTGCGTIFSVDPATGIETVVYEFQDGADGGTPTGGLLKVGSKLYGVSQGGGAEHCLYKHACSGVVFEFNPATGAEKGLYQFRGGTDGTNPAAGLSYSSGTLYGTTYRGGAADVGTVFSYTP